MKKRIGLISIHSDIHYGAALQAVALAHYLKENYDAKIIDYRKIPTNLPAYSPLKMLAFKLRSLKRVGRFRKFINPYLSNKRYNSLDELMHGFKEEFDVIAVGSDQVWNPKHCGIGALNPAYFLAFADSSKYKKISYASSVGEHVFTEEEKPLVNKWLREFSHISTRELFGKKQVEAIVKQDINLVVDPTLLLNKSQWSAIAKPVNIKKDYVLVYNVGSTLEKDSAYARKIADKYNWEVAFMSVKLKTHPNVDINIPHCGPAEFVWLFMNAKFIVTSSFHGVAFSINFGKDFINVYNPKSPQRVQALLDNVGLESRNIKDIREVNDLNIKIDYKDVTPRLERLRNSSIDYLLNAIEN